MSTIEYLEQKQEKKGVKMEASRARAISKEMNTLEKVLERIENLALHGHYECIAHIDKDVVEELIKLGYHIEKDIILPNLGYKISWH